jgi:integrase
MSRFPFKQKAQIFMQEYRHIFSKSTYEERDRRLRRMEKDFTLLWKEGKVSTTDPEKMTHEDVKAFFVLLRSRNMSANGIVHELGPLHALCQFFGNNCVETARKRFPGMQGHKPFRRLPTVPMDIIRKILDIGLRKESFVDLRDYAAVGINICAGLRPVEMQHALRDNLDLDQGLIYVSVVKGRGTYGEARTAPIHPDGLPLLRKYVEVRDRTNGGSDYLFPSNTHNEPLVCQSLRRFKGRVEEEIEYEITFQSGRRTYGQWLIDEGNPAETVSLHMGHRTSKTTETFYARQRESVAIDITKRIWNEKKNERPKGVDVN